MRVLALSDRDVRTLLPMERCIELVREALTTLARGGGVQPLRSATWLPDRRGLIGVMPGYLEGAQGGSLGLKFISVFPGAHAAGKASHQGLVALFEPEFGELVPHNRSFD